MYNYLEEMKRAIREDLNDNYGHHDDLINAIVNDEWDELEEKLNEDYWVDDAVTGNASGSFTFNCWTAKEYVLDNVDLAREAFTEFCEDPARLADYFLNEEWETIDVIIRCYLLGQAVAEALEEARDEYEALTPEEKEALTGEAA